MNFYLLIRNLLFYLSDYFCLGASQNHKLSIIELTTTMTATTKIHNIEDNIQYNHTVEEYNNSAPTALPDDLNITLNGVTSADTATDEPQTALSGIGPRKYMFTLDVLEILKCKLFGLKGTPV